MSYITLEEKLRMIDLYVTYNVTSQQIADILKRDQGYICKILKESGVTLRKNPGRKIYELNSSFFENIDTSEKAYLLGFIYADGNVFKGVLTIGQNTKDKYILEEFKRLLQTDVPIKDKAVHTSILGAEKKTYYSSTLRVCSKKLVQDLLVLGCPPKKSLILTFPNSSQIPTHLILSFIHGYFDGDGCISETSGQISFLGTYDFLSGVRTILNNSGTGKPKISPKGNIYYLSYGGINNIKAIYNLFYEVNSSPIYLKRKKQGFMDIINNHGKLPSGFYFKATDIGDILCDNSSRFSMTDAWRLLGKDNSKRPASYLRYIRFVSLKDSLLKVHTKEELVNNHNKNTYAVKEIFEDYVDYLTPTTYKITSPEGTIHITTDLVSFCKGLGFNPHALYRVAQGKRRHHKQWECIVIKE